MAGKSSSTVLVNVTDPFFAKAYSAGSPVPRSGIYKCSRCDREVTSNAQQGDVFPPHYPNTTCSSPSWVLHIVTDTHGNNFS